MKRLIILEYVKVNMFFIFLKYNLDFLLHFKLFFNIVIFGFCIEFESYI